MPNDNTAPLIGRTLAGKYTIESVVGTGAMGTIYRARQIALDKTVAVKVLHQALAQDPSFVDRFKLEAFSASRLEHPNSLRVLDFGKEEDLLFLVMEFVEADNLLSIMEREWPFEDDRTAQIVSQALAALAKAHDVGIVHRDLKPENILVLRGTDDEGNAIDIVKVCDFGIAKLAVPVADTHPFAPHATTEGVIVGTPDYMSPEQAQGDDVDARSDLYSMGVVLYHLLTGRTPFDADTPLGIAVQHVSQEPVPPSAIRVVHPQLEQVCLQAMHKRPEGRYQSAREMRRAVLAAVGAGAPLVSSLPPPVAFPTPLPIRERPRFATSTAPGEVTLTEADEIDETPMPIEWPSVRRRRASVVTFGILAIATVAASAVIAQRPGGVFGSGEVHSTTVALTPAPQVGAPIVTNTPPAPSPISPSSLLPDDAPRPTAARTADPKPRKTSGPAPSPRRTSEPSAAAAPIAATANEPEPSAPAPEPAAPSPVVVDTAPAVVVPPSPPRAQVVEAPAAPTVGAVDPTRASVAVGNITTNAGISGLKVRTAISHAPLTSCYRTALGKRGHAAPLQSTLKIDIDLSGHVVGASLSDDGNLPGLRACIETAARGITVRDVDTGDGSATITLTLSPQ
jgi:serine/threonine-protein kinase